MNLPSINKNQLIEEAVNLKSSGEYNCAQSVACAFADIVGMNQQQIYNISSAFGRGMGCMEGTCGSIAGAGIIIGLAAGDRVKATQTMAQLHHRFKERNGATICKHLKGISTDPATGQDIQGEPLRVCNLCVADSAEFLADALIEFKG